MNKDLMFSSNTDLWETPQSFFEGLNQIYQFTLDVCATEDNKKCERFFSPNDDGLAQTWDGVCWMNPPYGRNVTDKWVRKAFDESRSGHCTVVALLPARTDTKWFHNYIYEKEGVDLVFIKGRLKFGGAKDSAPFPSMIVVFNKQ
jgi:phage N-6-adenine-methyltransferase